MTRCARSEVGKDIRLGPRLRRDTALLAAVVFSVFSVLVYAEQGHQLGVDSHAYWNAWRGNLYDAAPGTLDAYLYSPAFAQALWPLSLLPWDLFRVLWLAFALVTLLWLVRPAPPVLALTLLLLSTHELLSGNVNWLLAAAVVVGFRRPGAWVVPLATKVTIAVGPIYFGARGEWRELGRCLLFAVLVLGASMLLAPHLWVEWVDFLASHAQSAGERTGAVVWPPLVYRLPVALAIVVWAARSNRPWWLPIAMILASPVGGSGQLALLAAVPRLRGAATATGPRSSGGSRK